MERPELRQAGGDEGSELAIEGGVFGPVKSCGSPPGTVIEVRNLFYNTPVRRTFLKSSAAVDYVKGALALDPKDSTRLLLYYFNYLEHSDKEIATLTGNATATIHSVTNRIFKKLDVHSRGEAVSMHLGFKRGMTKTALP